MSGALTFVSNSEAKLAEYRILLGMANLLREPLAKAESTTTNLDMLVREKCAEAMAYVEPPFFVEHTALEIPALGGWPGVLTEPFLSRNSTAKFLKMMEEYQDEQRSALAKVAIGYLSERGAKAKVLEGMVQGRIARQNRGKSGFGWDCIFIPDGETRTYAEMSLEEKNRTSMRAKVAASFKIVLEESMAVRNLGAPTSPSRSEKGARARSSATNVFVSYSHQDGKYLRKGELVDYLSGLTAEGFRFWYDRRIEPGDIWDDEIRKELEAADIALVLVSQSFLNSRYCMDVEVTAFLEKRAKLGMIIFPVILSPCDWKSHAWLASTQFEPRDGRSIARNFRDKGARAELYLSVLEQLRQLGKESRSRV